MTVTQCERSACFGGEIIRLVCKQFQFLTCGWLFPCRIISLARVFIQRHRTYRRSPHSELHLAQRRSVADRIKQASSGVRCVSRLSLRCLNARAHQRRSVANRFEQVSSGGQRLSVGCQPRRCPRRASCRWRRRRRRRTSWWWWWWRRRRRPWWTSRRRRRRRRPWWAVAVSRSVGRGHDAWRLNDRPACSRRCRCGDRWWRRPTKLALRHSFGEDQIERAAQHNVDPLGCSAAAE